VTATIQQNAPFPAGPVTINVPLTTPVETFPKDAIIDEFKTDPSQRDAVRAAVVAARVFHARDKSLNVRVKTAAAPVSLAMKIVVKQAGRENDAGSILVEMGKAPRWYPTYAYRARDLHGTVDVILRPDQSAADMQRNLGTYWGEEIVIAGVQIDAPYDVPFNRDESLRADVEKSVQLTQITRTPGDPRLGLSINFRFPPVKLVYYGFLRIGTHEVAANPDYGAWVVPSKQNYGFGTGSPEVDPSGQATKCDLILRPDPDWEARSQDLIPPWGGEVVIHDVPIVTTKAAADKK
jgi:hypothetical protein